MCGIAGWFEPNGAADRWVVEGLVTRLAHRGPDSWGVHRGSVATVGQTRLAIIDLVTGDPPITNASGDIGVALNGEIYNYAALRAELAGSGTPFRTRGDTEVIAALADHLEPVALAQRLDGMFCFAISDDRRERLVLGRDRLGEKPLHYWTDGRQLVFASEIKALLAHPSVPRRVDLSVVPDYLSFGYVPTPHTFYEGVLTLPPGHVLTMDRGGLRIERYWSPAPAPGIAHLRGDEAVGAVRGALRDAVRSRLVADVPVGAFLSGGLDSSSIVAAMAELHSAPVQTFTIGFEESAFDERPAARAVAERFGTDHTEFVVRPDAVALLDELVAVHDQPFGDSSALPTYLLSKLTREHVRVALCGDGGDELLAGYQRFAWAVAHARLRRVPGAVGVASLAARLPSSSTGMDRVRRAAALLGTPTLDVFRRWISYVDDDIVLALTGRRAPGWSEYLATFESTAGLPLLDRLQLLTLGSYLADDLLPKLDRTTMAHALEVRAPFLAPDFVETAFRLHPHARLRGRTGKWALRQAMVGILPETVLTRAKWGFGIPLDGWFRGPLAAYTQDLLGSPRSIVRGLVEPAALDGVLRAHADGSRSLGHALWTLSTLEAFLRREAA